MKGVENNPEFYKSIAYLFYAVVMVDNHARLKEKRKVQELVESEWSVKTKKLDSKEIIFSELKELFSVRYDKEQAFLYFRNFFLEHQELFSDDLKAKILHTADKIAMAFSGRNKSESVLISRIYFLMREQ